MPARFNIAEECCWHWARKDPGRLAVIDIDADLRRRDWSFGEIAEAARAFADALHARGVGRGDRVAVLLPQGPETLIAHFAAMRLGALSIPLFTLFGPEALAFRLADSGAAAVVTDAANLGKLNDLRAQLPDLRTVYCIERMPDGDAREGTCDFWAEIAMRERPQGENAGGGQAGVDASVPGWVDTRAEDPAMIIYTSGTTGPPKGAVQAHRFLLGHLPCVELHHEGFPAAGDLGWTPADWAWIGGLMDLALPFLYQGVPIVAHRMRKFDAEAAWAMIAKLGINRMFLPPAALRLMRQAHLPDGLALRSIGSGGESLGPEMLTWAETALNAPINEFYGQTECNLVVSSCRGLGVSRPGAMGRAVPGHTVAVIGEDGMPVADGMLGEIAVRRPDPVMFLGYWGNPAGTEAKFSGDWMRTGDLGRRDAEGYFTYVSRDDDVIGTSGYRVGPTEIENCIAGDPDIAVAAVIGVPDKQRGEAIAAYVVLRDGADSSGIAERIVQRVRERLSPHLAPRHVVIRPALPVTATGKIMRRHLRDAWAESGLGNGK